MAKRNVGVNAPRQGPIEQIAGGSFRQDRVVAIGGGPANPVGDAIRASLGTLGAVAEMMSKRETMAHRAHAYRESLKFDPKAVEVGPEEKGADALGRYVRTELGDLPGVTQDEYMRLVAPRFLTWLDRQRDIQDRQVFSDNVAALSGRLPTDPDSDQLQSDLGDVIAEGQAMGYSRAQVLGMAFPSALDAAAAQGLPGRVDELKKMLTDADGAVLLPQQVAQAESKAANVVSVKRYNHHVGRISGVQDWLGDDPKAVYQAVRDDPALTDVQRNTLYERIGARFTREKGHYDEARFANLERGVLAGRLSPEQAMAQVDAWVQLPSNNTDSMTPQFSSRMARIVGTRKERGFRMARVAGVLKGAAPTPEPGPAPDRPSTPPAAADDNVLPVSLEETVPVSASDAAPTPQAPASAAVVLTRSDDNAILETAAMAGAGISVAFDEHGAPVYQNITDAYKATAFFTMLGRVPDIIVKSVAAGAGSKDAAQAQENLVTYCTVRRSNPEDAAKMYDAMSQLGQLRADFLYSSALPPNAEDQDTMRAAVAERMPEALRLTVPEFSADQVQGLLWQGDADAVVRPQLGRAKAHDLFKKNMPRLLTANHKAGTVDPRVIETYMRLADRQFRVQVGLGKPMEQARKDALYNAAVLTSKLHTAVGWTDKTIVWTHATDLPVSDHYGPMIAADFARTVDPDDAEDMLEDFTPVWDEGEQAFILMDDAGSPYQYYDVKTKKTVLFVSDPHIESDSDSLHAWRVKMEGQARAKQEAMNESSGQAAQALMDANTMGLIPGQ